MEEVRSYWQVASISHFCTQFQKPFKLPIFEPEELEQAFIIDIPEPPRNQNNHFVDDHNNRPSSTNGEQSGDLELDKNHVFGQGTPDDQDGVDNDDADDKGANSPDYVPPPSHDRFQLPAQPTSSSTTTTTQQQNEEQSEMHLLVKLAIALLKPHFNSKISPANWENYLGRLIDLNWVELENCPSPFHIPIISPEGIELTKNLSFNELPLSDKIDVFSALCDYRFWCDDAAELIKDYAVEELRIESVGKDSQGHEYWYFSGTRLFRENKDLSQDLIFRKKRIKELEYKLVELERARILKEQEDKRKAELERAKQLANEAREARRQDAKTNNTNNRKKAKTSTPVLPPRTGLRERRSSAASNNNDTPARTLRSRAAKQQSSEPPTPQSQQKTTRGSRNNKSNEHSDSNKAPSPELPKISPLEECKEELEKLAIKPEERTEAWRVCCESLEEWENFVAKFEKTKSTNEKYLSNYLNEYILPTIRAIYAKRAAEVKRKERELLHSLATRRVSTRIISKRAQEEEQERLAQIRDAEIQKKKAEAELRLRAELEKEMRAKKNRFVINGETSSACSENGDDSARYNLRQHQESYDLDFDGIIHPDKLCEFYEALELIVDTVRTSKHAWPFVDPVPETVPGYYDLIEEPIDLKKIRTKVEFREYRSVIEIEKDFQLLVNNCEKFNGPKNVYTKMVYKLWKSFRKNVQLYLQRDLHMNEYETFIYPPQPAPRHHEGEQTHPNTNHNGITKDHDGNDDEDHQQGAGDMNQDFMETKCDAHLAETAQDNRTVTIKFEPQKTIKVDSPINKTVNSTTNILPQLEQSSFIVKPTLQFQPTPIELPFEQDIEIAEIPPEPLGEEVIVEMSYDQCSDKNAHLIQDQQIIGQQDQ